MLVVVIFFFSKVLRGREICNKSLLVCYLNVLYIWGFDGLLDGFYYFYG